jgi:type II secretory pathway pseudopilin PulG
MQAVHRPSSIANRRTEKGMSLIAVMAIMTIFATALLAVAPTVYIEVQREKELEQIRRGEEVAEAIRLYVSFYRGAKLPTKMDDLLEGLPYGTKKRMILRPSAAVDPLSEDGKWRLIKPESQGFINFAKRVQVYNNGLLPSNPSPQIFDRYSMVLVNVINTKSESDIEESDDMEIDDATDSTPFIGVASKSRSKSVIAYYGIENHSKWIYTPLFRGGGTRAVNTRGGPERRLPQQAQPNDNR